MIETTILGEMNNQMRSFTRAVNHNPVIISLAKGNVGLSVCLFVSEQHYSQCYEQIVIKFSEGIRGGLMKNWSECGGDLSFLK